MTTIIPVNEKTRRWPVTDVAHPGFDAVPRSLRSVPGETTAAPVVNAANTTGCSSWWVGDRAMSVATVAVPWTDRDGNIHEQVFGSDFARCGFFCDGDSHTARAKGFCDECTRLGKAAYALSHVCTLACRV